jgi:hypothetical protein
VLRPVLPKGIFKDLVPLENGFLSFLLLACFTCALIEVVFFSSGTGKGAGGGGGGKGAGGSGAGAGVALPLPKHMLNFLVHNGSYIFNNAGLTSTVHDCLYIFFGMDWFPTEVFF